MVPTALTSAAHLQRPLNLAMKTICRWLSYVVIAALQGMCLVAGFCSFFFRTFKYHSASPFSDWLETTNPSTCSSEAASQEQVFEHAAISDS